MDRQMYSQSDDNISTYSFFPPAPCKELDIEMYQIKRSQHCFHV